MDQANPEQAPKTIHGARARSDDCVFEGVSTSSASPSPAMVGPIIDLQYCHVYFPPPDSSFTITGQPFSAYLCCHKATSWLCYIPPLPRSTSCYFNCIGSDTTLIELYPRPGQLTLHRLSKRHEPITPTEFCQLPPVAVPADTTRTTGNVIGCLATTTHGF